MKAVPTLVCALGLASVDAAPANSLGNGCLSEQYTVLNDPLKVAKPFDVSDPANEFPFDYKNPPSMLALARSLVGKAWTGFLASICNTPPVEGPGWVGECRKYTSALRDALSLFVNLYPNGGQYGGVDPWWTVQEDVAHRGYYLSGDYLDLFGLQDNDAQKAEKYALIVAWHNDWIAKVGSAGKAIIPGTSVTYDQYVTLSGPVNADRSSPTVGSPLTWRPVLDQFWGEGGAMAKPELDAYENLAYLFRVVHSSALDGPDQVLDSRWDNVISQVDLTIDANKGVPGAAPDYKVANEFHELRKQVRAMWRNLQTFPQIMPAAWYTKTLEGAGGNLFLWSWDQMLTVFIDGHDVMKAFFDNDDKHVAYFKSWGWPDESIWLGTTMALGGYFHQDLEPVDDLTMIGSQAKFDFVERMGWINDEIMTFKYGVASGKDAVWQAAQRTKINTLWANLKGWFTRNSIKTRLREVATFLPKSTCSGQAISVQTKPNPFNPSIDATVTLTAEQAATPFPAVPIAVTSGLFAVAALLLCVVLHQRSKQQLQQQQAGSPPPSLLARVRAMSAFRKRGESSYAFSSTAASASASASAGPRIDRSPLMRTSSAVQSDCEMMVRD